MRGATDALLMRAIANPHDTLLFLLHGPDEAASRALADQIQGTMGEGAERIDLDGAALKGDPARLSDEATAISMFGDARWVRVTGGEECLAAVEALLSGPTGCPVVVIAGVLRPTSALLKLAHATDKVIAHASQKVSGARADALVTLLGQAIGVRLATDAARMLATATNGERGLIAAELEKLALYVDASPDRPRAVSVTDIEAIGAAIDVREPWTLVDAIFDGKSAVVAVELSGEARAEAIPALRAVTRRALAIGRTIAAKRGGQPPRGAPREREALERQARMSTAGLAASAHAAAMDAEAILKRPGSAGEIVANQAMIGLARATERRR